MSRRLRTAEDDRRNATTSPARATSPCSRSGYETGFWDDNGRPAPWPDDIDEWSPTTHEPLTVQPGEPPF